MGRRLLRLGAVSLLLLVGAASSLLAARPGTVHSSTATTATVTSPAAVVLALSGHGWGHGLGLSQWGAYGYARHGWTYDRILAHYYTGTTLGPAPVSTVRVLLAQAKKVTLSSTGPWNVVDGAKTKVALDPGALTLKPKLALTQQEQELEPPFTFAGKQPLLVDGKPYRGRLVVTSDGKRVQLVDLVGLEAYLQGVVPAEMPSGWPAEALKAQAVAARSYALANRTHGRDFDLYADVRDQVYGGVAAESTAASDAITATKGEVVLWNGKVADTLFFSTSGGRTASAAEATGSAVPYLVPVADPYDTASPYHDWGPMLLDGARVARALQVAAPLADVAVTTGPSGRAASVTVSGAHGTEARVTGSRFRSLLELRSTWFAPTLLSLLPSTKTITYGGAVSLTGFARGADDTVTLESKTPTADWAPAGELILGAGGAFATVVKPAVGTQYRLAWRNVRAGLARVAVAARVQAQQTAVGVEGTLRPVVPGSPVQLQQQSAGAWSTVSTTTVDAAGAWSFTDALEPGTYRVRCTPGRGVAAGVSTPFRVQ